MDKEGIFYGLFLIVIETFKKQHLKVSITITL